MMRANVRPRRILSSGRVVIPIMILGVCLMFGMSHTRGRLHSGCTRVVVLLRACPVVYSDRNPLPSGRVEDSCRTDACRSRGRRGPRPLGGGAGTFAASVNFDAHEWSKRAAAARLYTAEGHDHLAADGLPADGLAPLTQAAQRWIYERQHPADCSSARFLISSVESGMGSAMHVSGAHLAEALNAGRVFMWDSGAGKEWTDDQTCGGGLRTNWECFFRSPSNCTLESAGCGNDAASAVAEGAKCIRLKGTDPRFVSLVPGELGRRYMALRPHAAADEVKYWWRAQSVAYLMRMNNATLRAVTALRLNSSRHLVVPPNVLPHLAAEVPFPAGVTHSHIRRGDKAKEMELQSTARYFEAAENLTRLHPLALSRAIFVSTEDPLALAEAKGYAPKWSVLYTDIPRLNAAAGEERTTSPMALVRLMGMPVGAMVRAYLLQLLMALECDAWVGTRGSNWNRLVDELRCVWVDKCLQPYAELGGDGYDWRR